MATTIKTKGTEKKASVLSEQESTRLMDYAEHRAARLNTEPAWRDAVVIAVLFYTGVRVSAITDADVSDYTSEQGHRILRYAKKGGGRSFVRLEPAVVRVLDRYLQIRALRHSVRPDQLTGPLLVTIPHSYRPALTGGKRLTNRTITDQLQHLAHLAGLPPLDALSPHSGRGTTITLMLNGADIPLHKTREHVEHASPATTESYNQRQDRLIDSPAGRYADYLDTFRTPPPAYPPLPHPGEPARRGGQTRESPVPRPVEE